MNQFPVSPRTNDFPFNFDASERIAGQESLRLTQTRTEGQTVKTHKETTK
jgi:hypothetical protein